MRVASDDGSKKDGSGSTGDKPLTIKVENLLTEEENA